MNLLNKPLVLSVALVTLVTAGYTASISAAPADGLVAQVQKLTTAVEALGVVATNNEKTITALRLSNEALNKKLKCISSSSGDRDLIFEGCNVHVRNGEGSTSTTNRYGNLIIGYNKNEVATRAGSHNIVVGDLHEYSSYAGIVSGTQNTLSAPNATILSSIESTAGFISSTIIGADRGIADVNAVIVGGRRNYAAPGGDFGVLVGGRENAVYGSGAVSVGGVFGIASGSYAVTCGGDENSAVGYGATVSGGSRNTANGQSSSVSGGWSNSADGDDSSILGGSSIVVAVDYGTGP